MMDSEIEDDRLRDRLVALEMQSRLDAQELAIQRAIIDGVGHMLDADTRHQALEALSEVLKSAVGATGVLVTGHAADAFFAPKELTTDLLYCSVPDLIVVAEFRDYIYPGLVSTGKIERGGDKPYHTVINGENFHVLEALRVAKSCQDAAS